MRQVFLEKNSLIVHEVAEPLLEETCVLVSVHYSCISSGTESATIAHAQQSTFFNNISEKVKTVIDSVSHNGLLATHALIKNKLKGSLQTLGYSCSGKVIAVGKKVKKFKIGDFVACAGAGFAHHADIIKVPENLVVLVKNKHFLKSASATTLGAIALQGVRRAQLQIGETIGVIGLGLLGQITLQLVKESGCKVIGIDILDDRIALAKNAGADLVLHAYNSQIKEEIDFFTKHKGVDAVIITAASVSNEIVQQAMNIVRRKGRVVVVGDVGLHLKRDPFYKKEVDFLISCSYGPGRYDYEYEKEGKDYPYDYVRWTENRNMEMIVDYIEQGKLKIDYCLSQEFCLQDIQKAYQLVNEQKSLGVVLSYLPKDDFIFEPAVKASLGYKKFQKISKTIRVGFLGVGGFSKIKLLPLVSRMDHIKITAIIDADITNAENIKRTYGAAKALTEQTDLFKEDLVDALVIASPHIFHCDQALDALHQGKAVFIEKPLVTNFQQYKKISLYLKNNPNAPLCVDYNRSFAPFIQKIKWELVTKKSPVIIHYRMNAGYLAKDHWTQTELGAGRIIGEACHIFDLFCFLVNSVPLAVSVESLGPKTENLFPTDNFSVQISFLDGSLCTLLYTALGNSFLGKERMEVFYDGKSIVLDDYKMLTGYGLPVAFNQITHFPDKGHKVLLEKFFLALRKEEYSMPLSMERLDMVAKLTLIIDQLACKGGGQYEF